MTQLKAMAASQDNAEAVFNEVAATLSAAGIFGKKHDVTTGLAWGYYGGLYNGNDVADGTVTLADAATNYVVVRRSTGVVSASTSTTNGADALYARLYKLTTAGGAVTIEVDQRMDENGLLIGGGAGGGGGSGGTELRGLTFTSDTGSTADSDPGNGIFKWNNATEVSATFLYFDNQTADGLSMTTFFAALGSSGFIYMQQSDDETKWQLWKWTSSPTAGSGYYKFAVTSMASGGSIADNKTVFCDFSGAGGSAPTSRDTVTALSIASGVVNIDFSLGDYFTLALTANVTSITFSNLPGSGKGASLMLRITQDSTPRTVAWPASFRWEGSAPVVSTASGAIDVLAITTFDNGTKWDATLSKGRA